MANTPNTGNMNKSGMGEGRRDVQGGGTGVADKARDAVTGVADQARTVAGNVADKARDVTTNVVDRAKDMASNVADSARDWASTATEKAGDALGSLSGAVRDHMPDTECVTDAIESGTRYFQEHNFKEMADDVAGVIRRNPIPALLVGVGIGFLLARATTHRS